MFLNKMTNYNIVYVNDEKIENVIITTDSEGYNILNFKHNKQNNTWWINGELISNAVIITDNVGNSAFKSLFEAPRVTEPESVGIFKELLLTVHEANQSKYVNMNSYLEKKRLTFFDKLKYATEAYHVNSYLKSYEIFKECLQIYDADEYRDEYLLMTSDLVAIKLALALNRLKLGKGEDLNDAIQILITLEVQYGKQFPILCYYLGHAFYLLQYYDQAQNILQEGLKNIQELSSLTELNWPGSDKKIIYELDKAVLTSNLEKLYNECKAYHKPDELCQFIFCPKKNIYFSNPCFNGYVNLRCSRNCNISFHRECWKHKLKNNQVKKPSLLIDCICETSDCGGLLKEIIIYDGKLNINTTMHSNEKISEIGSKWWSSNKCKQVPNAKNLTEKSVSDNKSDKKLPSDPFSKCKSAEQKNTLSSTEKNTLVNNTHSESKLNSFAKEYVLLHNQDRPQFPLNSQLNLTDSGSFDIKTHFSVDEAALVSVQCQNSLNNAKITPISGTDLNCDKSENENAKKFRSSIYELLNPNADIFVPMVHQKGIEITAINSNLKNNSPCLLGNVCNTKVPNASEANIKSSGTILVTSDNLTEFNVNIQENLKNDSLNNSSVLIACQKPICLEETSKNSNKVFSDKPQNLKNDCFNNLINLFNLNLESFILRTDCIATKELNSDMPDNLKSECAIIPFSSIDCQNPLKSTNVTPDANITNQFNLNAKPFVPFACEPPLENKTGKAVCVSSINNLYNSTEEPYVSKTSAEAKEISKFIALNHSGEDEKKLTAQTSIETKAKQIQTVRIKKLSQKIVKTKEKQLQTDLSISNSSEIQSLKSQVDILKIQLFQAEEAYNELLHEFNGYLEQKNKSFIDCETQTLNSACTHCKNSKKLLDKKTAEIVALKVNVHEVLNTNKQLKILTNDLQTTVSRNKTNYEIANKILLMENENLKTLAHSYQAALNRRDSHRKNTPVTFQKMLTEQLNYISKAYMSYFSIFENKCKHMAWELHDLLSLSNYNSFPSQQELEENLAVWTKALEDCKNNEQLVTNFFSQLIVKISPENLTTLTVATPVPNLLQEPPNIMMRHFKAILALNRKLEQDMNKNLMTLYKPANVSCPQPQLNNENMIDLNSDFLENIGACSTPQSRCVPVAKETEVDNPLANVSISTSTSEVTSTFSDVSKPPIKKEVVPKATLVGQDKLLQRITQQFPLTSIQTLSIALQTIRQRHGGLTGRDFRGIVLEVKAIVKEISSNPKEKVKIPESKPSNQNTVSLPPWKQVSSGVTWNNENPDLNCTICFDIMEKKSSVNLRCQHMFHRECIKQWLQTDSICPICRMFAILDDEFPPLK